MGGTALALWSAAVFRRFPLALNTYPALDVQCWRGRTLKHRAIPQARDSIDLDQ